MNYLQGTSFVLKYADARAGATYSISFDYNCSATLWILDSLIVVNNKCNGITKSKHLVKCESAMCHSGM